MSAKQDSAHAARILVVDDNEPFRRFIISTLHEQSNLQVIGEEEDGIEAVQRAEALQPDLILLDIGLLGLNGIDAARRMAELAPNARIIFLTQESSPDVVHEALGLGAWNSTVHQRRSNCPSVTPELVLTGKMPSPSRAGAHQHARETAIGERRTFHQIGTRPRYCDLR